MENKNSTFERIWRELKSANKVLITLHYRPDGDSLGSCTAMKSVLERLGKEVALVSKDELGENLGGFSFTKEVEFGRDIQNENLDAFDCIVFLDYAAADSDFSLEFMEKLKSRNVINIDHHKTNSYFGRLNYVNENLPSACSLLVDFFQKNRVRFDGELCRRLLLGICTDTNFGEYEDSADTFEKMAFLIREGRIDFQKEFVNPLRNSTPWKIKKLSGILLTNMKKAEINGKPVAYSWAKRADYKQQDLELADIRHGIFCMQDIRDTDLIFNLIETTDGIKGSFRSKTLDTTIYSEALGGGGHKKASAFILKGMNMKKAIKLVLKTIEEKGFVSAD